MASEGAAAQRPGATVDDLTGTLARLRKSWENYALSGLGESPEAGAGGTQQALAQGSFSGVKDWRKFTAATHAMMLMPLKIEDRLAVRASSRAWCRAAEAEGSKAAWLVALNKAAVFGAAAGAATDGCGLAAFYARHRFLAAGAAAGVFLGRSSGHGEVRAAGRLRFRSPVAGLCDGTAAALVDCAPIHLPPDLTLNVWDMSSLTIVGTVPISTAKHGRSLTRPCSVVSMQSVRNSGINPAQAVIVAVERIVVVFSWLLGSSGDSEAGLCGIRDAVAEEVRWGAGGKEVLRSASFVGTGAAAPVVVLMENSKDGPSVEVYRKAEGALPYVLTHLIPISKAKVPGAIPGAVYGGSVVLWATAGERAIEFVRIRPPSAAVEDAGSTSGAGAVFARARQAARGGRLRVGGTEGGAGLDMEPTRWGYLVEDVEEEPGQPDVNVGEIIFSIGGQALYDLDEETMQWRFGRMFADGAEITVLPKEHVKAIMEADKGGAPGKAAAAAAVTAGRASSSKAEEHKRQHFMFSARLEAWCVSCCRDPPRMVAVTDNRLVLADLTDDGALTREALSGLARAPWKRPVERIALLDEASDVLLAGVAAGVLIWRVPALAGFGGEPQLLSSVKMPPHCTLMGASLGINCCTSALGWVAADLSVSSDGSFDVWQFYTGRHKPILQIPAAARAGRRPGFGGDAVAQAFAAVGRASDAVTSALAAAATAEGPAEAAGRMLKAWVPKLKQDRLEPLYAAVEKAEPACAEAVRELRRWLRAEGRMAGAQRQDGARDLVEWIEECRRQVLWPLQVAFQAEVSEDEDLPTRASMAANARSTGAAAGTVPQGVQ